MLLINTLLLFTFLHVQSYCLDFCSCSSCARASALLSEPVRSVAWFYPIEGLLVGMLLFLILYYRMWYDKKLLSHEKLGLIQSLVHRTVTPLTLVHHLLEELLKENFSELSRLKLQQALDYATHIQECHRKMQAFGRMDGNAHSHPQTAEYELSAYISSLVNHCKVYARMRQIELELHQSPAYVRCCLDALSMSAVLEHLLKKMIDNTPSGGRIDVVISHSPDSWKLQVANAAQGATGNQSRLLHLVSAHLPEYYWGGLQAAKKVVRLHGGKLILRKHGAMSAFEVIIPAQGKNERQENELSEPETVEKGNASVALPRVLLVMADKELNAFLSERLAEDFSVDVLTDIEKVSSFCSRQMPDAIIVDETVNGAEGNKFCSHLKSHVLLNDIPLILLVNPGDDEEYAAHVECGAEKVELRSVHVPRLKADIRAAMAHRKLMYERIKNFLPVLSGDAGKKGEKKEKEELSFQERVRGFVEKNLRTEGYSIMKLCSDMAMSRTSFYNKMKQNTELAPEDYIFLFRMEKAKILLATHRHSISEVAELVGFCDPKYFGKRFKKLYNMSPSDYMRSIP